MSIIKQASRKQRSCLVQDGGLGLDSVDREVGSANLLGDTTCLALLNVRLPDLVGKDGVKCPLYNNKQRQVPCPIILSSRCQHVLKYNKSESASHLAI